MLITFDISIGSLKNIEKVGILWSTSWSILLALIFLA